MFPRQPQIPHPHVRSSETETLKLRGSESLAQGRHRPHPGYEPAQEPFTPNKGSQAVILLRTVPYSEERRTDPETAEIIKTRSRLRKAGQQ